MLLVYIYTRKNRHTYIDDEEKLPITLNIYTAVYFSLMIVNCTNSKASLLPRIQLNPFTTKNTKIENQINISCNSHYTIVFRLKLPRKRLTIFQFRLYYR